jgi:hypothetical protein
MQVINVRYCADEGAIRCVERIVRERAISDFANAVAHHLLGAALTYRFPDHLTTSGLNETGFSTVSRTIGYKIGDSFFQAFVRPDDVNIADLLRIRSDGLRPVVLVPDSLRTELAQLFLA